MTIKIGTCYSKDHASGRTSLYVVTRTNEKSVWYDRLLDGVFQHNHRVSIATWMKKRGAA